MEKCLFCGSPLTDNSVNNTKKFCNKSCKDKFHRRQGIKIYTYTCQQCGIEYHPKDKRNNKYCSNKCKSRISNKIKTERLINKFIITYTGRINVCVGCGKIFISGNGGKFCSIKCSSYYYDSKKHTEKIKTCIECGAKFFDRYGDKRRNYCSIGCSKKSNRRMRDVRKRVGKKDAVVDHFTLYQILIRDNYKCGICGKEIDVSLKYTDRMSATIDHIIPLSKGGKHCWNNVQAAHLACNSTKWNIIDYVHQERGGESGKNRKK